MEFNINDRVQVKDFDSLPEDRKNRNWGKVCGKVGVVVDKLFSEAAQTSVYKILFDGATAPSSINFTDDMFEAVAGGGCNRSLHHHRRESCGSPYVSKRKRGSLQSRTHLSRRIGWGGASGLIRLQEALNVLRGESKYREAVNE